MDRLSTCSCHFPYLCQVGMLTGILKAKGTGDKPSSQVSSRILGGNFNSKFITAAIYDNNLSSTFLKTLAL